MFAKDALLAGLKKDLNFTNCAAMDMAMYLPLAMALGAKQITSKITPLILDANIPKQKYYENTLIILSLVTTFFPNETDIDPNHIMSDVSLSKISNQFISDINKSSNGNFSSASFKWWEAYKGNTQDFSFANNKNGIEIKGTVRDGYFLGGNGTQLSQSLTMDHTINFKFNDVSGDPANLQIRIEVNGKNFGKDVSACTNKEVNLLMDEFKKVVDGWKLSGRSLNANDLEKGNINFKVGVSGKQNSGKYDVNLSQIEFKN